MLLSGLEVQPIDNVSNNCLYSNIVHAVCVCVCIIRTTCDMWYCVHVLMGLYVVCVCVYVYPLTQPPILISFSKNCFSWRKSITCFSIFPKTSKASTTECVIIAVLNRFQQSIKSEAILSILISLTA